jgi:hypothetical protein
MTPIAHVFTTDICCCSKRDKNKRKHRPTKTFSAIVEEGVQAPEWKVVSRSCDNIPNKQYAASAATTIAQVTFGGSTKPWFLQRAVDERRATSRDTSLVTAAQ